MSYLSLPGPRAIAAASILFACSLIAAEQPPNASGTLKVNGITTNLHHAYAFQNAEDNTTRVLITSRPLDAAMLGEESSGYSVSDAPFSHLAKKGQIGGIELCINPKNEVETVWVSDKGFDTPTPTSGHDFWFEPYKMTGGWVGGQSRTKQRESFFKTKWEYNVTFFAPVGQKTFDIAPASAILAQRKAIDARERILPAGGGEEGAMYLAYRKNLEAGNGKAVLDQMTPSMQSAIAAEQHESLPLSDSALRMWAFLNSGAPGKVEVVGGLRGPDATLLELRKTSGEQQRFGVAKLVKDQGKWKVAEETWR